MIVMSERAEAESKRLMKQATPILPIPLSAELVKRVSCIDGAVTVTRMASVMQLGLFSMVWRRRRETLLAELATIPPCDILSQEMGFRRC